MIVQVTNTGGELDGNQFDLAFPGGGFGIFDGCTRQYPNTPASNWGARYGGVSSSTQCDGLPSALRSGCKLRFGWGKGMDNPAAQFRLVACPSAITQRSGFQRA
jgi:hypothetical protein